MSYNDELFDLPGCRRPRRMFCAHSTCKGRNGKEINRYTYILASTPFIAKRVAERDAKNFRAKLTCIYPVTWEEYGHALRMAGLQTSPPTR